VTQNGKRIFAKRRKEEKMLKPVELDKQSGLLAGQRLLRDSIRSLQDDKEREQLKAKSLTAKSVPIAIGISL
jgi:hypothetical protein